MQSLEVNGAVRPTYGSLGVKRLMYLRDQYDTQDNELTHTK